MNPFLAHWLTHLLAYLGGLRVEHCHWAFLWKVAWRLHSSQVSSSVGCVSQDCYRTQIVDVLVTRGPIGFENLYMIDLVENQNNFNIPNW